MRERTHVCSRPKLVKSARGTVNERSKVRYRTTYIVDLDGVRRECCRVCSNGHAGETFSGHVQPAEKSDSQSRVKSNLSTCRRQRQRPTGISKGGLRRGVVLRLELERNSVSGLCRDVRGGVNQPCSSANHDFMIVRCAGRCSGRCSWATTIGRTRGRG
jgi:hypothetical protein